MDKNRKGGELMLNLGHSAASSDENNEETLKTSTLHFFPEHGRCLWLNNLKELIRYAINKGLKYIIIKSLKENLQDRF